MWKNGPARPSTHHVTGSLYKKIYSGEHVGISYIDSLKTYQSVLNS